MRHPSGPNLPGHPVCGPGKIFYHEQGICISLNVYKKKMGPMGTGGQMPGGKRMLVNGASS